MTEIPLTLLTRSLVAGGCVFIRTGRAAPPLGEQRRVAPEVER
jgi:hypothetical protein